MVKIEKDRFTVEVYTGGAAHENYVETMSGIIELLQCQADDMLEKNYHLLEMLKQMLPTEEQARALYNEIKDLPDTEAPKPQRLRVVKNL